MSSNIQSIFLISQEFHHHLQGSNLFIMNKKVKRPSILAYQNMVALSIEENIQNTLPISIEENLKSRGWLMTKEHLK